MNSDGTMTAVGIKARLSLQRALWGVVTPNIRAVAVGWAPGRVRARFIFDDEVSSDDQDVVSAVESEVYADFNDGTLVEFMADTDRAPELRHRAGETWWAYRRWEPSAGPIPTERRSGGESGVSSARDRAQRRRGKPARVSDENTFRRDILLSLQRALGGEVRPDLRAVAVGCGGGVARVRFIYDRPPTEVDWDTVREVDMSVQDDFEDEIETKFSADFDDGPALHHQPGEDWWAYVRRER